VRFTDYQVLSFDCYGTLINWEAGIGAVLSPWAKSRGLTLNEEQLLTAYSTHEATAEAEQPTDPYPGILARSLRALGNELDAAVTNQDAAALATSVPPGARHHRGKLKSIDRRVPLCRTGPSRSRRSRPR